MPGTNFMQSKNAEGNQSNYPTYSKVSKKKKKKDFAGFRSNSVFELNLTWFSSLNFSAHFSSTFRKHL